MEIVHLKIVLLITINEVLLELFDIYLIWGSLHHHLHAVLYDWNSGDNHYDREEVGADRVHPPEAWPYIDDDGSDNHPNAHDHISKHMKECCIN